MVRLFCLVRALVFPFLLVPATIIVSLLMVILGFTGLSLSFARWLARLWTGLVLWLAGVRVVLEGVENVPTGGGFLYLFTHSSHFDVPALYSHSPRVFSFGAKAELFKIPFFAQGMQAAGTLPIARGDRESVIAVYKRAESRVANGEAFALAPEGGRRATLHLAPFKTGPFMFAINAKMPLVPAVIYGAEVVLPKGRFLINPKQWRATIVIRFLPKIPVVDESPATAKVLRDRVYNLMVAAHADLVKKYS